MDNFIVSNMRTIKQDKNKELTHLGDTEIKFINKSYLVSFKEYMKNEIDNFSPNKNTGEIHILLKSIWHHYIFQNVPDDKYYDLIKILNENIENNK